MHDGLPPDYFRKGQDFQSQRARYRAKGADTAKMSDDARGGPKPRDVFSGNMRSIDGTVTSKKITQQPSHQDAYGAGHEMVRKYQKFSKPVG